MQLPQSDCYSNIYEKHLRFHRGWILRTASVTLTDVTDLPCSSLFCIHPIVNNFFLKVRNRSGCSLPTHINWKVMGDPSPFQQQRYFYLHKHILGTYLSYNSQVWPNQQILKSTDPVHTDIKQIFLQDWRPLQFCRKI